MPHVTINLSNDGSQMFQSWRKRRNFTRRHKIVEVSKSFACWVRELRMRAQFRWWWWGRWWWWCLCAVNLEGNAQAPGMYCRWMEQLDTMQCDVRDNFWCLLHSWLWRSELQSHTCDHFVVFVFFCLYSYHIQWFTVPSFGFDYDVCPFFIL